MLRINWTFQAKKDLKEIVEYISKDSKLYAKTTSFKNSKQNQYFKRP